VIRTSKSGHEPERREPSSVVYFRGKHLILSAL
jgi:hypothetical protein